jgi:hypothetical protein
MARETRLLRWLPLTPPDAGRSCDGCGEEGVAYTVGKYARRTSPQAVTLACDLSKALDNDHCLPGARKRPGVRQLRGAGGGIRHHGLRKAVEHCQVNCRPQSPPSP